MKEMKMKMMRRTVAKAAIVAVVAMIGAVGIGAGEAARQVTAGELQSKAVVVVGTLGKPLGTYVTVEGDYFGPRAMTKSGLYVDAINTIDRGATIRIDVEDRSMKAGRRYRLRGYETGGFGGTVDDPQNPPSKEEVQGRQKSGGVFELEFSVTFHVTKAEDLGPAKEAKP
jgi:hypothetical protein